MALKGALFENLASNDPLIRLHASLIAAGKKLRLFCSLPNPSEEDAERSKVSLSVTRFDSIQECVDGITYH